MKRLVWMLGVGLTGFLIGGKVGALRGGLIGLAWGVGIGYAFGSIFSESGATKKLIAYWVGGLGLFGPIFGLIFFAPLYVYDSTHQLTTFVAKGAGIGMGLGFLVGFIQFARRRRVSQPHPGEQAPG
jgi:hypothetical protein